MGGGGGALNTATPQKILTNTASPQTASPSHTLRFEITATPKIEILFTSSPRQKSNNTATPQIPMSPSSKLQNKLGDENFFLSLPSRD